MKAENKIILHWCTILAILKVWRLTINFRMLKCDYLETEVRYLMGVLCNACSCSTDSLYVDVASIQQC